MKYYNGLVICSDGSVAVVNFTAAPRLQIRLNKKARQIQVWKAGAYQRPQVNVVHSKYLRTISIGQEW